MNYRYILVALLLLPCLFGCYTTATKAQVDARVSSGKSFPDKLIHDRSDKKYDYYRIVDGLNGFTIERYRVPKNVTLKKPDISD